MKYAVLSPDGLKIVFSSDAKIGEASGAIYEVPVSGGLPRKIFGDPKASCVLGAADGSGYAFHGGSVRGLPLS